MKRHLSAILAADIVGYSRLMEADEAGTIARQKMHMANTVKPAIEAQDGHIVKLMGDGILIEFPSVVGAVACAVAIQQKMAKSEEDAHKDQRISYRIGINLGDVFYEDGDIFGDGVNIAARLEQMADPGGICISGTAYDHLKSNIPVTYQALGNISVKNIKQPVRVYRVLLSGQTAQPSGKTRGRLSAALVAVALIAGGGLWWINGGGLGTLWPQSAESAEPDAVSPDNTLNATGIPDRPSIAVLPFDNLSNDPEQEYFSDGMTEDLITDLSKVSGLFVLARNTMFTYKGKAVNVQDVARELNVDFVLEGSVRRIDDRVRINVQLIDANTGGHIWARRFDRDVTDIFALQDEVTQKIVTALAITLNTDEQKRMTRSNPIKPKAYDLLLRGLEKVRRFSLETNLEARDLFEQAVAVEPEFSRAQADLAFTYSIAVDQHWTDTPVSDGKRGLEIGLKALELDPNKAEVHFVLSLIYRNIGQIEQSIIASRRAIELDPNYADGFASLAMALNFGGKSQEALSLVERATRLNPLKPFYYTWIEGQSHYLLGNYQAAKRLFTQVINSNPHFSIAHKYLAATHVKLGQLDDAIWATDELMTSAPNFTLTLEQVQAGYVDPIVKSGYIDALREAGLE